MGIWCFSKQVFCCGGVWTGKGDPSPAEHWGCSQSRSHTLDLHGFDPICAAHMSCKGQEQYSAHSRLMCSAVFPLIGRTGTETMASWTSERSEQGKKARDKRAERWETRKVTGLDRGDLPDCGCHEGRQVEKGKRAQEWREVGCWRGDAAANGLGGSGSIQQTLGG